MTVTGTVSGPYPSFTGYKARCPKCEGGLSSSWHSAGTRPVIPPVPLGRRSMRTGPFEELGEGPEWLLRQCQECEFTAGLSELDTEGLLSRMHMEGYDRYQLRLDRKDSRAELCNQRIAVYEARLVRIDPGAARLRFPTSPNPQRGGPWCCVYEFGDRSLCILGERHGGAVHISSASQQVPLGVDRTVGVGS